MTDLREKAEDIFAEVGDANSYKEVRERIEYIEQALLEARQEALREAAEVAREFECLSEDCCVERYNIADKIEKLMEDK